MSRRPDPNTPSHRGLVNTDTQTWDGIKRPVDFSDAEWERFITTRECDHHWVRGGTWLQRLTGGYDKCSKCGTYLD